MTWTGDYDANESGEYTLTASLAGYTYADAYPYAVVVVSATDTDTTAGVTSATTPNGTESAASTLSSEATITTADTRSNGSGIEISLYDYDSNLINKVGDTHLTNDDDTVNGNSSWFVFMGYVYYNITDYVQILDTEATQWFNAQAGGTIGASQGVLENRLDEDGYPVLSEGLLPISEDSSLAPLFSDAGYSAVTAYENLTGLFSYDEDTKTYSYDSSSNFATLDPDGDGNMSDTFTVYARAGTGTNLSGTTTLNFFPFNVIDVGYATANYHFGMKVTMDFLMPEDGKVQTTSGSSDMVFSFNGDDDVWVFVDDVLILDLGGVHAALSGEISFTEGTVTVDYVYRIGNTIVSLADQVRYIGDLLYEGYVGETDGADWIDQNLYTKTFSSSSACAATTCTETGEHTHYFLKDLTENRVSHSLSMFYMERAGGTSNCELSFNLLLDEEIDLELPLEKTLLGWEEEDEYTFSYSCSQVEWDETTSTWTNTDLSSDIESITVSDITVSESSAGTGSLSIVFDESLGSIIEDRTYYFKISEDNSGDYVTYDDGYYIVEVTLSVDGNGLYTSEITSVTRYTADGTKDNSYSWTSEDDPLTFTNSLTSEITIVKQNSDGNTLEGAEFYLYYVDNATYYYYQKIGTEISWVTNSAGATPLTTDETGKIVISGLKMSRTYYLKETKAPDGYLLPDSPITIFWTTNTTSDATLQVTGASGIPATINDAGEIVVTNELRKGTISGLVWVDADGDGIRETESGGADEYVASTAGSFATVGGVAIPNSAEYLFNLDGLTATLMVWDTSAESWKTVTNSEGSSSATITLSETGSTATTFVASIGGKEYTLTLRADENWGYYIYGVPAGTYAVLFSTDAFALGRYEASPQNEGENDTLDSDASATYVNLNDDTTTDLADGYWLSSSIVESITITNADYVSENNDSGLVPRLGSVEIVKTGEDGASLEGVTFTLKLLMTDDDPEDVDWGDTDVAITVEAEAVTNSDGKLVFKDLWPGTYQLIETGTGSTSGTSLLADPVYITIPFTSTEEGDSPVSYAFNNTNYWLSLGYDITNGSILALPSAGSTSSIPWWAWPASGAAVIALASGMALVAHTRRSRRTESPCDSMTV